MKAEKALAKVEESLKPVGPTQDPETITDEERFMFRKLGLRMKAFLLLGNIFFFLFPIPQHHTSSNKNRKRKEKSKNIEYSGHVWYYPSFSHALI